jgi:hypothetical protein
VQSSEAGADFPERNPFAARLVFHPKSSIFSSAHKISNYWQHDDGLQKTVAIDALKPR